MTDIPFNKLYFSYWTGPGEVSKLVVPIKNTPHFRFADVAVKEADPTRNLPQGTGYGRYARWESYCFLKKPVQPKDQMHSEGKFAANIKAWKQNFDVNHPIEVCFHPAGFYVIDDGAHRAAYCLAAKVSEATTIKAVVKNMPDGLYKGIDGTANALSVDKIISMANTIPPLPATAPGGR